ncbi:unnamed protein product, partial [Acidithrix sp. C25]
VTHEDDKESSLAPLRISLVPLNLLGEIATLSGVTKAELS